MLSYPIVSSRISCCWDDDSEGWNYQSDNSHGRVPTEIRGVGALKYSCTFGNPTLKIRSQIVIFETINLKCSYSFGSSWKPHSKEYITQTIYINHLFVYTIRVGITRKQLTSGYSLKVPSNPQSFWKLVRQLFSVQTLLTESHKIVLPNMIFLLQKY